MNRLETFSLLPSTELERFFGFGRPVPHPHRLYRLDGGIRIELDLPGRSKEALRISLDGRELSARIEGESEGLLKFTLGKGLSQEGIEAELKHGVLTIQVPKSTTEGPKEIPIH